MSTKIDVLSELASRLTKKGGEDLKILTNDGAGLPVIDNAVRNRSEEELRRSQSFRGASKKI